MMVNKVKNEVVVPMGGKTRIHLLGGVKDDEEEDDNDDDDDDEEEEDGDDNVKDFLFVEAEEDEE